MMQELTLTGATLLSSGNDSEYERLNAATTTSTSSSNASTTGGAGAGGGRGGTGGIPITVSSAANVTLANGFSSTATTLLTETLEVDPTKAIMATNNNKNKSACCDKSNHCAPQLIAPPSSIRLKMSPQDLVRNYNDDQLLAMIHNIVRMGTFELMQDIWNAWKQYKNEQQHQHQHHQQTSHSKSVEELLGQPDAAGHSLLHWSTKRVDDLRFVRAFAGTIVDLYAVTTDTARMTALHWACTTHALPMIRTLLEIEQQQQQQQQSQHPTRHNNNNNSNNNNKSLLEMPDSTGCTPLLIAAQHGQVETVAYLIHCWDCNKLATDENQDTALHWAAYKGSEAVLGLLCFYPDLTARALFQPDSYGQTPLHLAALRGNTSACRYLLQQMEQYQQQQNQQSGSASTTTNHSKAMAVLQLKDQNGRTPIELAIHKQKPATASILQAKWNQYDYERKTLLFHHGNSNNNKMSALWHRWRYFVQRRGDAWKQVTSLQTWKLWLGLLVSDDGTMDESPVFPYYYVTAIIVANILYFFTYFWPIGQRTDVGMLWDKIGIVCIMMVLMVANVWALYKTKYTNPGKLDATHPATQYYRNLYHATLQSYADDKNNSSNNNPMSCKKKKKHELQLCHTCHIARPLRCKHDRFTRACIVQFDHHCPFVANSVGYGNYRYFYLLLLSMTLYLIFYWYLFIVYWTRQGERHNNANDDKNSSGLGQWLAFFVGLFLGIHILFSGGMLMYHTQLVGANLTTNEHINVRKYDYLWEEQGQQQDGHHHQNQSHGAPGVDPLQQQQLQHQHAAAQRRKFKNPFDRGFFNNLLNRIVLPPNPSTYMLPEDFNEMVSTEMGPLLRDEGHHNNINSSKSSSSSNNNKFDHVV